MNRADGVFPSAFLISQKKGGSGTDIRENRAYKYAVYAAAPNNPKVGRYVRRQCAEWLEMCEGRHPAAFIDEWAFRKITKLLKIIVHPDLGVSMYEGLEDYALLFIFALFCTKSTETALRYYTTGLLEIARKNYKTFTSAVIFIIAMLISPKFARFFSVAPDLKLSSELKIALKKIIKSSPALEKYFKVMRSEIRCFINDTEYTPLAYSNDKLDGKLAYIFLADEVGAMDSYPVEAMRSSQVNLAEPLGILISTQYPNDNNGFIDEVDFAKKQLDGVYEGDERTFALMYEPDDEIIKEWEQNDNVIYQANPVAINNERLFKRLVTKRTLAVLYENKRENFLCKHCNIKYQGLGVEGYIDIVKVRACARPEDIEWWRGRNVWLGLDLSQTTDNTAVAMVTFDEDDRIYAKVWGFLPADRTELKSVTEKVDYKRHIAAGECFSCGDEVIDYGYVERFVLSLESVYGVRVVQCGYDRYNAISTAQKLESDSEHPIKCVEIKQHSSVLHPATKLLKEAVLQERFAYDENALLEINFQNARCREDTNLNKYVDKKKSAGKVDMVVALINALFLAQLEMLSRQRDFVVQY